MKYIVVLGDGMSDYPIPELGNRTVLQAANKPNMDILSEMGEIGMVKTVPEGFPPGSDVANLSVIGYEPEVYYTGRSPLEAVSMGVELGDNDTSFRCNLVTLSEEDNYQDALMLDYSAQEITTAEAGELINSLNAALGTDIIKFYPGISYRHLMVWAEGESDFSLTPPHDISDRRITDHLPKGEGSEILLNMMVKSREVFKNHPVNQARIARGLKPATSIWLWGQGKKPALIPFEKKFGVKGAVISAVDLIKGIGICADLLVKNVPGSTGNVHTNFLGKGEAALEVLKEGNDFVFVHVEAPDEAGHQGNLADKIKAVEEIDAKVLGTILHGIEEIDADYRIMVLPDHPTPLSIKTHTSEPVPYLIYDSTAKKKEKASIYNEENAQASGNYFPNGPSLMEYFIR